MPPRARVLIVDDSRIFRAALEASLTGQEGIEVVGSVFSGQKALDFLQATPPDVVTLDLEIPGMDGLETLRAIQRFNATQTPGAAVGVIMVSAHTKRGADVTMQALRDGAFDFVAKPSGPRPDENLDQLRQQLLSKIHQFLLSRRACGAGAGRRGAGGPARTPGRDAGPAPSVAPSGSPPAGPRPGHRRLDRRPQGAGNRAPGSPAPHGLADPHRATHAAELHAVLGGEPRAARRGQRGRGPGRRPGPRRRRTSPPAASTCCCGSTKDAWSPGSTNSHRKTAADPRRMSCFARPPPPCAAIWSRSS